VPSLEIVHERPYHLFVISQDMEHFSTFTRRSSRIVTWTIDVTLPKAGYYTVLSDFLPTAGASQVILASARDRGLRGRPRRRQRASRRRHESREGCRRS
jgi:hypothetical protein